MRHTPTTLVVTLLMALFILASSQTWARTNGSVQRKARAAVSDSTRDMTLAEVRARILGKKVVVGGEVAAVFSPHDKNLMAWSYGERKGDRYAEIDAIKRRLPESYLGKEADVVAVQLNSIELERVSKPNALGEVTSEDSIINPYCDVVVRLADGVIAIHTSYPSLFFSDFVRPFRLKSAQDDRAATINRQLPSIIGKTVYAAGFSKIFQPTAAVEDLTPDSSQRVFDIPRLRPLKITAAKYNEVHDLIILKLKSDEGGEYLTSSKLTTRSSDQRPFLEQAAGSPPASLLTSLADFTPRELSAVRDAEIYEGMSKDVLYYILGFPEKENNWGRGLKQLVY